MDSSKSRVNDLSQRFKRFRWLIVPAIIFLLALLIAWPKVRAFKFFYAVEQASLSLRFLLRGVEDPGLDNRKIVIVTLDDRSLFPVLSEEDVVRNPQVALLDEPWPWNRKVHGFLAQRLIDAGASVVAFDFVFPTPNPGDLDFLDVIEANEGHIVLGYDYTVSTNELDEALVEERLPYDDLLPLDESRLIGFVNINRDPDGVLRRTKLKTNIYEEKAPFISDDAVRERVMRLAKAEPGYFSLAAQTALLDSPELSAVINDLPDAPIINYGGLDYFPQVSYIDVILGDRFQAHDGLFQDAVVFVGSFSDFFKDVQQTPYGDMYGVETHAHAARSLLNGSFYTEVSTPWLLTLIGVLALFLCSGFLFLRSATSKGVFLLLLLVGNLVLAHIFFFAFSLVTPVTPVLLLVGVGGTLLLLVDYIIEQYERRRLKSYLDRYVSPEVATLIVQAPEHLDQLLSGDKRSLMTMFVDIRGFTAISERADPQELVDQLNEYFEAIVAVILAHNGSLNKYIGDAVLAVWGGIYSDGSAADCCKALEASIEMLESLEQLNESWATRGLPRLDIGIGLSYGVGFVGNLGHSQRKEFAVMGDVVNLASRIEGLTKIYACPILLSGEVKDCIGDSSALHEVDEVRVKGRSTPVRIYRPRGMVEDSSLDLWSEALHLYRNREFEKARALFHKYEGLEPQDSALVALFVGRCERYLEQPPSADWQGVTDLKEK